MKIIKKFPYSPIDRIDTEHGRRYLANNRQLPSVTTILSATKDMTYLNEWKNNVGEYMANKISSEASTLGTGMHQNIENYILDKPITGSFMARALSSTIIKLGMPSVTEIWGTEISLYSDGLYAGTTDLVGMWHDKPAIMDFKNSLKEKKREWIDDYGAQLAAYAIAHNEMYGTDIRCGVIMLVTRDAKYQEFIYEGSEFDRCTNIWLDRLTKYYTGIHCK